MSKNLLEEPGAMRAILRAQRRGTWTGVHVVDLQGHAYEALGISGSKEQPLVHCRTLDRNITILYPAKDLIVLERTYEYD
jgi:hypothetical protein